MRLNKYLAQATGLSRRAADATIADGRVAVNEQQPTLGQVVQPGDVVKLDGRVVEPTETTTTIMLHKPVGYICSRDGQGGHTIYELLPPEYQALKPVGRLDKNSSGLLLLTNDGQLAYELTHPKFAKTKVYEVSLNKPLSSLDQAALSQGVQLEDGLSKLEVLPLGREWQVRMSEGRNRQIRRTFEALGYRVRRLHRTDFGLYTLGTLKLGKITVL